MKKPTQTTEPERTIGDLYPELEPAHQKEAEENLDRYAALVLRIYERLRAEMDAEAALRRLTSSEKDASMDAKRSNPT